MDHQAIKEKTSKVFGQIVAKAWQDQAFMSRLRQDPKAVLKEHGIDLPEDVTVNVVEAKPNEYFLVIPPRPSRELDDEQLANVSGGASAPTSDGHKSHNDNPTQIPIGTPISLFDLFGPRST